MSGKEDLFKRIMSLQRKKGGGEGADPLADLPPLDDDLPPIEEAAGGSGAPPAGGPAGAPSSLDEMISIAKQRLQKASVPEKSGPQPRAAAASPSPAVEEIPSVAQELPAVDADLAAAVDPAFDLKDPGLVEPLDPMDVDRILQERKLKEQNSLRRLLTVEFLPPAPRTVEETGLSFAILSDLVIKLLYNYTELEGLKIAELLCLPFNGVIEPVVRRLKDEKFLEIKGGGSSMAAQWRFSITSKGIEKAHEVLSRNGYIGPAPVPIEQYTQMVLRQKLEPQVTLKEVKAVFNDMVISEEIMEKIGPAVNSAKSVFLYGPPGNGKTSIAERMCDLLGGAIFVPYAIEVAGQIIKIFDDYVHQIPPEVANLMNEDVEYSRMDHRWVICKRPFVVVGGELTLEMLDLTYNDTTKYYEAPFQLKSNCGMLLIDDFGRQKVRPRDLLNRWIVPLEKNVDYLTLHTGKKVEVPFEQFICFSTNLEPKDLVDEAFLRRLRYKIEISDPDEKEYIEIFRRMCRKMGIPYSKEMVTYLIERYYKRENVPFRACHPRDLLEQLVDRAKYRRMKPQLTPELIDHAWSSYFVKL